MSEERAIVEKQKTERKRANELDGKAWLRYSISIWNDLKKTKEEIDLKHPAMFPNALALRLIECFTIGMRVWYLILLRALALRL